MVDAAGRGSWQPLQARLAKLNVSPLSFLSNTPLWRYVVRRVWLPLQAPLATSSCFAAMHVTLLGSNAVINFQACSL